MRQGRWEIKDECPVVFSVCSCSPGEMGPRVASTLKLGIAILNGGNSTVQQVFRCSLISLSVMCMASFFL